MYQPMRANTSIQLSITLASIFFNILSDLVTSLNKVKSNMTVPYIELLNHCDDMEKVQRVLPMVLAASLYHRIEILLLA